MEEQWSAWDKEVVRVGQRSGIGAWKSSGQPGAKKWSVWGREVVRVGQSSGIGAGRAVVSLGQRRDQLGAEKWSE